MHIHELHAENFKRIRVVDVVFPESGTVEICGANGSGKTSCLDSIWAAVGGAKASPDLPIRTGSIKATVALNLGKYTVERTWTAKGSTLTVRNADGTKPPGTPQAILDGLLSRLAFDPLEFVRMKPAEQAAMLRRVVGLDTAALDAERAAVYADRTEVNRAAKQQEAILLEMPEVEPADELSAAELNAQLQAATAHNRTVADVRREAERKEDGIDSLTLHIQADESALITARGKLTDATNEYTRLDSLVVDEIDTSDILRQIAELNAQLQAATTHNKQVVANRQAAQRKQDEGQYAIREIRSLETRLATDRKNLETGIAEHKRFVDAIPAEHDTAPILAAIASAEATNRRARAYAERQAASERLRGIRQQAEDLTQRITDIDSQRQAMLTAAKMPVKGMSLDGEVVTINGIPFSQVSTSEQIIASVATVAASKSELRAMRIAEGSLLDEDNLKHIARWATKHNFQVFIERVANSTVGVGLVIEEGMVRDQVGQEVT